MSTRCSGAQIARRGRQPLAGRLPGSGPQPPSRHYPRMHALTNFFAVRSFYSGCRICQLAAADQSSDRAASAMIDVEAEPDLRGRVRCCVDAV